APQPARGEGCAPPAPPESAGRRAWLLGLPRFAPAALAVTGLAGGWLGWAAWQRWPLHEQRFSTARGSTREVVLPDGSTLWLDTATQAEIAYYRGGREVRLSGGQAMFDVRADAGRPFHVLAGALRITVVGTRFSVRHAAGGMFGQGVYVSVEEGRVAVVRSGGPATLFQVAEAIELGAGQSVAADAQGHLGAAVRAPDGEPAAWRHGRIDFADATLGQALAEFERYGPVSLVVRDPAVAALRVHGSFAWREQDAFARALPRVLPVRLRRLADGRAEIVGKGRE
ncbi:FecR family protein, partial [Thauera linaloolentis]